MLQVSSIKLNPGEDMDVLLRKTAKILRVKDEEILSLKILKKSIDAREQLLFVYAVAVTLANESNILKHCKNRNVAPYTPPIYQLPSLKKESGRHPVVVGAGPAGLFACLVLARCGLSPILLERGQPVDQRQKDVHTFWTTGQLDLNSNVQFGEGGAGAFSDGKLNTGTKDIRHRFILEELVHHGAPETILYDAKPHVGTDMLHKTLISLRKELISLGTDIRFGHRLVGVEITDRRLSGVKVSSLDKDYTLPASQLILALGHSARDTVEMLYDAGISMEAKPFAMGVRIEHLQKDMDMAQYKKYASHPCLPASTYKLACHLPNGRSAFSFCVCPGGQVVAATSEQHQVVTNGMSEYARDRENINGALLVNVTPEDFPSSHPLSGIALQRQLEKAAFCLGGSNYYAPCQRVEDFLAGKPSTSHGVVHPSYLPGVTYTDLHRCLPPFISETLELALPVLDRKVHGYAAGDALLTAVESRSSSPVRFFRDENGQSNIQGIYPCGEGAGFAGGILSAAADGMRIAELLIGGIL